MEAIVFTFPFGTRQGFIKEQFEGAEGYEESIHESRDLCLPDVDKRLWRAKSHHPRICRCRPSQTRQATSNYELVGKSTPVPFKYAEFSDSLHKSLRLLGVRNYRETADGSVRRRKYCSVDQLGGTDCDRGPVKRVVGLRAVKMKAFVFIHD